MVVDIMYSKKQCVYAAPSSSSRLWIYYLHYIEYAAPSSSQLKSYHGWRRWPPNVALRQARLSCCLEASCYIRADTKGTWSEAQTLERPTGTNACVEQYYLSKLFNTLSKNKLHM
jgi:hypothetical protein